MLYLVTGGSGSGKSEYAENKLCKLSEKTNGRKIYLATMIPYGKETEEKIKRHRKMRSKKFFETKECFTDLIGFAKKMQYKKPLAEKDVLLLECMSNLVANELFDKTGLYAALKKSYPEITNNEVVEKLVEYISEGVYRLKDIYKDVVIVTNEVFSESTVYSEDMSLYKQILGTVNCRLAGQAKEVTEVVYGHPVLYKEDKGTNMNDKKMGLHLIIGGAYQGKLEYAKKIYPQIQWIDGEKDSFEMLQSANGIYHFEAYVKRILKDENMDAKKIVDQVVTKQGQRILICDEIGYGLVPVDAFERYYREQVGRVCTGLAQQADSVTRVVCGIGMSLK